MRDPSHIALLGRFSEWSSACWEIQRDYLLGTDQSIDLRFLAVYQNDEASFLKAAQDLRVGRAMDQWWDKSDEAGPRSRENVRFQQDPPSLEVLSATVGTGTLLNLWKDSALCFFPNQHCDLVAMVTQIYFL